MKLEVELSEQMVKNMKGYAAVHDITVDDLVSVLFFENCQEPTSILGKIKVNDEEKEFNEFAEKLMSCLDTAVSDDKMINATIDRLKAWHISKPVMITDLYKVYKKRPPYT